MDEQADMREAYYHWVLSDVCDMIRLYGYTKVLLDIDKTLHADDLEVELHHSLGFKSNFEEDVE